MPIHYDKDQDQQQQANQTQTPAPQQTQVVDDNRPEAELGRDLQEMANSSPRAQEGAQLKAGAQAEADTTGPKRNVNKTGIPDRLKAVVEYFSGFSLDEVRVHYNSDKPALINAYAYAEGFNIYLGPGQEKHLAHEVWHVVQQMKGKVSANKDMDGEKVNDQANLEKEASNMGDKASKTKEITSPTTGTPLVTKGISGIVKQLAKVETKGGTFETDQYKTTVKDGGQDPIDKGSHYVQGIMALQFSAADSIDSSSIGLIQTTTPTVKKGDAKRESYAAGRSDGRSLTASVQGEDVEKSLYLDRQGGNISPVFGASNPEKLDNKENLKPEAFHDADQDQTGKHTLDDLGNEKDSAPAKLHDTPGRDWKKGWDVEQSFETTALCLEGDMKGTYLGSVEWGYKAATKEDSDEPVASVMELKKIKEMVPTAAFKDAADKWNNDKTSVKVDLDEPVETGMLKIPSSDAVDHAQYDGLKTCAEVLTELEKLNDANKTTLRNKAQLLQMHYFELSQDFDLTKAFAALGELDKVGGKVPKLEKEYLEKITWRRVSELMKAKNDIDFSTAWLTSYKDYLDNPRHLAALEKIRDLRWKGEEWVIDEDILGALGENISVTTTEAIAEKWLKGKANCVILYCLLPDLIDKKDNLKEGDRFFVPVGTEY